MLFVIWSVVLVVTLVLYFRQKYSYFSRNGIKELRIIPPFGTLAGVVTRQEHFVDIFDRLYNSFPDEKFVGFYEFVRPLVILRDIELVKKITIKDFEHFLDHRIQIDEDIDPLFGRNLFAMKGQKWKDMRSTMSPAFTSSKMRHMVPFMVEVGEQMIQAIQKKINESKDHQTDIETKDLATRFANDVIATCAFGLVVDSQKDPENKFYLVGKQATNFGYLQQMRFFLSSSWPSIIKYTKQTLFPKSVNDFFRMLVSDTMKSREERNIYRPDMIHLLMEAKKGKLTREDTVDADAGFATVDETTDLGNTKIHRVWTDDDLTAQAVIFFFAGFETISTAMAFLLHELAVNPEVQDKLAKEIEEYDAKTNGKFDYTSIQQMEYMDMVVSELMRLWPPAIALDRVCVKDYNFGKPNSTSKKDFIIRAGEAVGIPVWAFHRDPNYFPDPLKFDPERFSEENKHKIKPFSYMPFGLGPRNCIGSRFALCELKVMVYLLMKKFEASPCEKTRIPIKLDVSNFNPRIEGGHWVRLKARY